MKYNQIVTASFISRENRFVATVELEGKEHTVHVKNTGRCKELLVPGAALFLERAAEGNRRTLFDLVGVVKNPPNRSPIMINMDSQAPNRLAAEWLPKSGLFSESATFRREYTYGKSRFDFFITDGERKILLEVKGVTLEKDGVAYFPDAPTLRGVKHLKELTSALDEGHEAYVLFVIQMKGILRFAPNDRTHPEFGEALRAAAQKGVKILAVDCYVNHPEVAIDSLVEVTL